MPVPVVVKEARRFIGERLDPAPSSFQPKVSAETAWTELQAVRPQRGGGRDELLLGFFSGKGYTRVPAWALFTSRLAQPLDRLSLPPGVKPRADAGPCVLVDVLSVLNADDGRFFYQTTGTSSGL